MPEPAVRRPANGSFHLPIVLIATVLLVSLATPVHAQDRPTWGARPAPGTGDRASGAFNLKGAAGSDLSDGVEIFNFSEAPAAFDVYAADAVPAEGGGLTAAARDAKVTPPATWIAVAQSTVEVPPRSAVTVPFTIRIPDGTMAGDHTAALLVEPLETVGSGPVTTKTRVALWVNLAVTSTEGDVHGDTSGRSGVPWIPGVLLVFAVILWLVYVTRDSRGRWFQEWRDERALVRDFRNRRRMERRFHDHR